MYGEETETPKVWEAKRYIVTDLSENPNGYDLTLAEYAENIYETGPIKERESDIKNVPPLVLDRKLLYDLIETERARDPNTSPQAIGSVARDVFKAKVPAAIAEGTPRFRGSFNVPGLSDGTIGGVKMNLNDWIWYYGPDTGTGANRWLTQYVYQWTSTGWVQRPRPSQNPAYGWLYLDAASSIGQGMPLGIFSDVFCQALVAEVAFIANLFAQKMILRSPNGSIQSENYQVGKLGFIIKANGDVEFNIGIFKGHIEAASGTFHGRIEGQEGYIKGTLCAGGRWDINGNSVNTNAPGLFVPGVGSAGGMFAKATTMLIESAMQVSKNMEFDNALITHNPKTRTQLQTWVSGPYSLNQLNMAIVDKIDTNAHTLGYRIPINGSVSIYHVGTESSSAYTVVYILSYMEYRPAGYYRLYGLAIDGHGNMSASVATLDCTGSDQVTASFVIL